MSESKRRVVITGTGVVSCTGQNRDLFWKNLLASTPGVHAINEFKEIALNVTGGGDVGIEGVSVSQRHEAMAQKSINEALGEAGLIPGPVGFSWSCGLDMFETFGGSSDAKGSIRRAGALFLRLADRFEGPATMVATACASGAQAIGEAFRSVRSGRLESCVAGGSSMILSPFYLIGFSALGAVACDRDEFSPEESCRPFDEKRSGFSLSDGAAAVVVESLESARKRGANVLAEIKAFGVSQDAYDYHRPPEDGRGAALSIHRALQEAAISPREIHAINAHATGTLTGDVAEATAIRTVFKNQWEKIPICAIKGAVGHSMSAAGAIQAVASVCSGRNGVLPPTVNLKNPGEGCELYHVMERPLFADVKNILSLSFGMGGQNAALVIQRMNDE